MQVTPIKLSTPRCTGECVCTCNISCNTQCSSDCILHCKCKCTCAHMLPIYAAHNQNIQYTTSETSESSSCDDSCANAKRNQLAHKISTKNIDYDTHVRMLKRTIIDEQYKTSQIEYYNTQLCEIINKRTEATKHTQQLLEILTKSLSTVLLSLPQPKLDTTIDNTLLN